MEFRVLVLLALCSVCLSQSPLILWSNNPEEGYKQESFEYIDELYFKQILSQLTPDSQIAFYLLHNMKTNQFSVMAKTHPKSFATIKKSIQTAASSNLYPEMRLSMDQFEATLISLGINTQKFYIKNEHEIQELSSEISKSKANCLIFEIEQNIDVIYQLSEIIDQKFIDCTSIFMGIEVYSRATKRMMGEEKLNQGLSLIAVPEWKFGNDHVNSVVLGALLYSLIMLSIAIYGFLLMYRIQTPKTFAKQGLVLGKVQE